MGRNRVNNESESVRAGRAWSFPFFIILWGTAHLMGCSRATVKVRAGRPQGLKPGYLSPGQGYRKGIPVPQTGSPYISTLSHEVAGSATQRGMLRAGG